MNVVKSIFKVGFGAAVGGAIAAVVSSKTAPEDPSSKRYKIRQYLRDANRAGQQAKSAKQAELISRFREDVNDADALDTAVDHSAPGMDAAIARNLPIVTAAGNHS
jgi:hypothetical protein